MSNLSNFSYLKQQKTQKLSSLDIYQKYIKNISKITKLYVQRSPPPTNVQGLHIFLHFDEISSQLFLMCWKNLEISA